MLGGLTTGRTLAKSIKRDLKEIGMMDIGQLIMDGPILLNIKENGVATITLNRPEVFNALNEETADAFNLALEEIEKG